MLGNVTILPRKDDIKCHDDRYQRNFSIPKYPYRDIKSTLGDIIVNIVKIIKFVI